MKIRVRYFAGIREALGRSEEWVSVPDGVRTVGDVRDYLMGRGGVWQDALGKTGKLYAACQLKMAKWETPISENDEIAFFPPVTGG